MKVVSIDNARTTWLFPVEEILPLGGAEGQRIVEAITTRYRFSHPPENPTREDVEKNGLKFSGGLFGHNDRTLNIVDLIVFNDGIVCSASTTEGADAFLQELYSFLRSEFKFREITSQLKKVHVSSVVVEFGSSLNSAIKGGGIVDLVAHHLNLAEGTKFPAEVARVDFTLNKDPEFRPQNLPRFTIEKRVHASFSQHRYFSSAPLTTEQHLSVLEQIERKLPKAP